MSERIGGQRVCAEDERRRDSGGRGDRRWGGREGGKGGKEGKEGRGRKEEEGGKGDPPADYRDACRQTRARPLAHAGSRVCMLSNARRYLLYGQEPFEQVESTSDDVLRGDADKDLMRAARLAMRRSHLIARLHYGRLEMRAATVCLRRAREGVGHGWRRSSAPWMALFVEAH